MSVQHTIMQAPRAQTNSAIEPIARLDGSGCDLRVDCEARQQKSFSANEIYRQTKFSSQLPRN
eukprot:scaffold211140_cov19-Prasinocladus_malaysianus.AAC.1